MIDRKYSRSNDTGRFELIHKGPPVAVPSYVGIDLRVEGKKMIILFFLSSSSSSLIFEDGRG